ncbi:hypothetical protein DLAC_01463 [Tieghemostelium lacteum]|uniref:EGF-like domain-containing protein n=1 Tax=Tieghemostelium lacteum TaxID=361077 RepID=A0A152A5H7_TIELA|nr:hypothetical protein DLAC_01463 [Tieghemostelium lacteum]|eukprot:KYR01476.1 hypothetical protein DLAC_01463 [Tieghemostelium lacteum]
MAFKDFLLVIVLFLCIINLSSACSENERLALNTFYTNTQPWANYAWDDDQLDCCARSFVSCNDFGNVTQIYFSAPDLFQDSPLNVQIDFTALSSLETIGFQMCSISIQTMLLPTSVKNLILISIDFSLMTTTIESFQSLESLTISTGLEQTFSFSSTMNNLKFITVFGDFDSNPLYLPIIQQIQVIDASENTVQDLIENAVDMDTLTDLSIGTNSGLEYGSFPTELASKNMFSLFLNGVTFTGSFPVFSDTYLEIGIEGNFEDIPEKLPPHIETFSCTCWSFEAVIPEGWAESTNLTDLNISSNLFYGGIPMALVTQLDTFYGSDNLFNSTIEYLVNVKPFSYWDLSFNNLIGEIPDFQYLVYQNAMILKSNQLYGLVERYMYCYSNIFDILSVSDLMLTSNKKPKNDSISFENGSDSEASLRTTKTFEPGSLYLNLNLYKLDFIENNNDVENNYCNSIYRDAKVINYVTPAPYQGGKITISNEMFLYPDPNAQPVLTKNIKSSRSANLLDKILLKETVQDLDPDFDEYEFFNDNYGYVKLETASDNINLKCRLISWKNLVECEVPPYASNFNFYTFEDMNTNYRGIGPYSYVKAPVIYSVENENSGIVSIFGDNFGTPEQFLQSAVQLLGNDASEINCPIQFRNDSLIVCKRPKLKSNETIVYSPQVTVGDQISTLIKQAPDQIVYPSADIGAPSNCYGRSGGNRCSGFGRCTENQLCQCDMGFRGIFCEVDSDVVKSVPVTIDKTAPNGTFETEETTNKFTVSLFEVRELDLRSRVVKKFSPIWTLTFSNDTQAIFSGQVQDSTTITVQMDFHSKPKVLTFADTVIQTDPSTLKFTVTMSAYSFEKSANSLQVVFKTVSEASTAAQDKCDESASETPATVQTDPNIGDVKWIQMGSGNSQITGKVVNRCVLDGRVIYIKYTTEQTAVNQINLVANIPYFRTSAVIDPSYAALLQPDSDSSVSSDSKCKKSNSWKIATGVVVGVVGAVAVAVGGYVLYKKKRVENEFNQQMKKLSAASSTQQ